MSEAAPRGRRQARPDNPTGGSLVSSRPGAWGPDFAARQRVLFSGCVRPAKDRVFATNPRRREGIVGEGNWPSTRARRLIKAAFGSEGGDPIHGS